jgi:hypothetical protein
MEKVNIKHDIERYENIFNMYQFDNSNGDTYVFYNILSKISLPSDLDENIFDFYKITGKMPLTTLSYIFYRTQHLWWLIMVINNIKNPVKNIEAGSVIKIIKREYLDSIFESLKNKI